MTKQSPLAEVKSSRFVRANNHFWDIKSYMFQPQLKAASLLFQLKMHLHLTLIQPVNNGTWPRQLLNTNLIFSSSTIIITLLENTTRSLNNTWTTAALLPLLNETVRILPFQHWQQHGLVCLFFLAATLSCCPACSLLTQQLRLICNMDNHAS